MNRPMRVVICWSGVSGYLAACWRALSRQTGLELIVLAEPAVQPYSLALLDGIRHTILEKNEWCDVHLMARRVLGLSPDIVVISGWSRRGFAELPFQRGLEKVPFLLAMDTPWRNQWRQRLASYWLQRLVKRMSGVFVAGERGRQYALALGFPADGICEGVYGCDYDAFAVAAAARQSLSEWPRRFLYVGRYVSTKGIVTLAEAYQAYCERVPNPWPLSCYGAGELRGLLEAVKGIEVHDFMQPVDQPHMFAGHGALVMPSSYEPWGVVLAEAGAAGLPAVCSTAVCSSLDLVRHLYNGYVVPPENGEALTSGLQWIHDHVDLLPEMGKRSQIYAGAYSAQSWALRWKWMLQRAFEKPESLG